MTSKAPATGQVQIGLLNGFRLEVDGVRADPPASAQRLLAYLALCGPAERLAVAGSMWADAEEAHALGSLRTAVWRANRCVPQLVRTDRSMVALADFVRVDITDCLAAASRVLGTAFRRAAGHGHLDDSAADLLISGPVGELLPGWYDDWVLYERERLRQAHLHALEAASARLLDSGQHALALDMALDVVHSEPLRESGHRLVIRVHLAEGNLADAVVCFDRFRDHLYAELGIEPSAEFYTLGATFGRGARLAPPGRVTGPAAARW